MSIHPECLVDFISELGIADEIQVLVLHKQQPAPCLSVLVKMPISEMAAVWSPHSWHSTCCTDSVHFVYDCTHRDEVKSTGSKSCIYDYLLLWYAGTKLTRTSVHVMEWQQWNTINHIMKIVCAKLPEGMLWGLSLSLSLFIKVNITGNN